MNSEKLSIMVVTKGWGAEEMMRDISQRVQTFHYKSNKFWGSKVQYGCFS